MKIRPALLLLFSLVFVHCKDAPKGTNSDQTTDAISDSAAWAQQEELSSTNGTWVIDSLSVDDIVRIDNNPKEQGMSISVFLAYPVSSPEGANLPAIQKTIAGIFDYSKKASSPKEAFDNTVASYRKEAQDYAQEWEKEESHHIDFSTFEQNVRLSVEHIYSRLMTVSTGYSSFLGGAHGSYFIRYSNIEISNGKLLTEETLFKKGYEKKLASLIQNEISRRNNLPDQDEHLSLLIDLEKVQSSSNFYFDKSGIVYVYNQYEITPYVQGVVEINIPYNQFMPLINEAYLPLINSVEKENA